MLVWITEPFSRDVPNIGTEPSLLHRLHWQAGSLALALQGNLIPHVENSKDTFIKLKELINEFSKKFQDTELIHRFLLHSYPLKMKNLNKIKVTILFTITSKRKKKNT